MTDNTNTTHIDCEDQGVEGVVRDVAFPKQESSLEV